MEAEHQLETMEQWYERAIALDWNWRESQSEEKRLRGRKKNNRTPAPRSSNREVFRQAVPQPQVWPKRQELPQQRVSTGLAPMEGVERTNVMMARPQQQGAVFPPRNPYAMDVDRRENRNCYACGRFGHLARNYRNRGIGMNRRMKVD